MTTPLAEGEFELDGLVFGGFTSYGVTGFDTGRRSFRTQDQPVPRNDGRLFGRDELEPRTLGYTIQCLAPDDPAGARALERDLATAWSGEGVFREPGANMPLRIRSVGSDATRRVFGRPRRYHAPEDDVILGLVEVTADFATVDQLYYADNPIGVTLDIVTTADTGLAGSWQDPLADAGVATSRPGLVFVPGQVSTPHIVVRWDGPVTHPGFEIVGVGSVSLNTSLVDGEWVELGLHPSMRYARRESGGSVAGKVVGTPLDEIRLPVGQAEVRYSGLDTTATSSMTFTAYPAFTSL